MGNYDWTNQNAWLPGAWAQGAWSDGAFADGAWAKIANWAWNLKRSNTANVRAAYAARSRNVRIAFTGSSVMRGVDETAVPYNSQYLNATPMQLAAKLNAAGINAGASNWYGLSGASMSDYLLRDSRLAVTGAASQDSAVCQGGAAIALTAAGSVSFTTTAPATKAVIVQYDFFAGATISWQVDGGATTNIAQVGNNSIKTTTVSLGASGIHTLKLNWVSGPNSIFGIECYDDSGARTEVTCVQWGISGATSSAMIDDSGNPHAGRLHQMIVQKPDLMISECGLPNSWRNGDSVSSCISDMTTFVQTAQANGIDFMFMTPPWDNANSGNTANQAQYVAGMFQVAKTLDVPVIDTRAKFGTYTQSCAQGFQVANDAVHPTKAGYVASADILFQPVKFALGII